MKLNNARYDFSWTPLADMTKKRATFVNRILLSFMIAALMTACGGGGGGSSSSGGNNNSSSPSPQPATPQPPAVQNLLSISVNGPACNSYLNEPCVSVTVCTPGTSNCQTIDGIMLDTGSFGLRIFKQVLSVPLTQVTAGSGSLAECVQFGLNSSDWGPVQMASVILGNEPPVSVPIQVIDSTFGKLPNACSSADRSPSQSGFNGILGVGPLIHDCGPACVSSVIGQYFTCTGSICSGTIVAFGNQVQNPVALLPVDNNGIIVELPSVSSTGAASVSGTLVLGIGTQSNNSVAAGVALYSTNTSGEIAAVFNNTSLPGSFIDSGSNGLFFPSALSPSPLPNCADNPDWFCPSATTNLAANNLAASGSPVPVSFSIGNFDNVISTSNHVFSNIGGNFTGSFDWGLPFFLGRNIYVGIEGTKAVFPVNTATGPYFAY